MLLKNKSLIEVIIELDLSTGEVTKFHFDYLMLKYKHKVNYILKENDVKIEEILKVSDFLNANNIDINDLIYNIDLTNNISKLKSEYDMIESENFNLKESNK